jgi:hypothetical protein
MSTRRKASASAAIDTADGPVLGTLARGSRVGSLLVEVPGGGTRKARTTLKLDAESLRRAVETRQAALLLFENGDATRPIVVGLVQAETETPLLDEVLEAAPGPRVQAKVDGRTKLIEAKDELVLKCGPTSITLRRNGKIVIRGLYVESYASGTNRIKGGAVRIN